MRIPATSELANQHLSALEGAIAQTSPLNNKAFLRVVAALLAMAHTGLYKYGAERSLQNLVLTARGDALDLLGNEVRVFRKMAEAAVVRVTVNASNGVTVPVTAAFVAELNGLTYAANGPAVAGDDGATIDLTAEVMGAAGNLQLADTLNIVSPVPGVASTGVVTELINSGADDETDEEYRPRILLKLRSTEGGDNATSYKQWAEEVAGVVRAFPYAGRPVSEGDSFPGDRTVYVEADTEIDPDGVPTEGLLTEVRAAINYDPATGLSRPTLGIVDATLWVEPITRTTFNVLITNLVAPDGTEASVRADIESVLTPFFPLFAPYIDGVDLPQDRNDRITTPALSTALQDVLNTWGASAASVAFSVGGTPYSAYQLAAGELAKLGVVTYATV